MIKETSKCRVHVERVISYLKDWRCLQIKNQQMLFWATHLVHVCGFLTNLQKLHLAESGEKLVQVHERSRAPTPGPSTQGDGDPSRDELERSSRLERARRKAREARASVQERIAQSQRQAVRVRTQQRIKRAHQKTLRIRNACRERQALSRRKAIEIRAKRLAGQSVAPPHVSGL